jgi:predicted dehydrogenase
VPFNAPNDRPCLLRLDTAGDLFGRDVETIEIETCDQYRIQGDEFSRSVLEDSEVPYPLEMSLQNMRLIEAVFRSAESGRWEAAE